MERFLKHLCFSSTSFNQTKVGLEDHLNLNDIEEQNDIENQDLQHADMFLRTYIYILSRCFSSDVFFS